ncbi:MAG TPA: hypothetical protein VER55_06740, partial [Ardenticatenaceae bacterium]|nr:hypothetical protein [Ardenticatenaceae bacterium]
MRDRLRALALRGVAWTLRGRRAISAKPADRLRVLLIRPDHLGDVLFLTPALAALRRAQPAAHITALVGPWAEPVLRGNPDLDGIEILAFPWFDRKRARTLVAPYVSLVRAAASLKGRFDIAIVLRFDHWWGGWLAAAAGIHRRIGYATPQLAPFLTEAVPYRPGRHEVLQSLTLTARLGTPGSTRPDEAPLRYFQSASAVTEAARWTSGSRP